MKVDEEILDSGHATPRPWEFVERDGFIVGGGHVIAQLWSKQEEDFDDAQDNGKLIVTAVNGWGALCEQNTTLKRHLAILLEGLPVFPDSDAPNKRIEPHHLGMMTVGEIREARAALALVTEHKEME